MDADEQASESVGSAVFAVLLWMLCGYLATGAFGFSYPANVAPMIVGGVAFALMTWVAVRTVTQVATGPRAARDLGQAAALAWAIASIVLLTTLGFLIGMTLAMLGLFRIYARERWPTTLAMTGGVMLALYLAFGAGLGVAFYPGTLGLWG